MPKEKEKPQRDIDSSFVALDLVWQSISKQSEFSDLPWLSLDLGYKRDANVSLQQLIFYNASLNGKRILSTNCGIDSGLHVLASNHRPLMVTGLDFDASRVMSARINFPSGRVRFQIADPSKLPFVNEEFDVLLDMGMPVLDSRLWPDLINANRALAIDGEFIHMGVWPSEMILTLAETLSDFGFQCESIQDIAKEICHARSEHPEGLVDTLCNATEFSASDWNEYLALPGSSVWNCLNNGTLGFVVLHARKIQRIEKQQTCEFLGTRFSRINQHLVEEAETAIAAKKWFPFNSPSHDSELNIVAFAHAGAGASTFRYWEKAMLPEWNFCAVQLPGRENRINETVITDLRQAAEKLVPRLLPYCNKPLVLIGWSLGSKLAFEIACQLEKRGIAAPLMIFTGVCPAPHEYPPDLETVVEDTDIKTLLRKLGGTSEAILRNQELLAIIQKAMNGDIEMARSYRSTEVINTPIVGISTQEDSLVSFEQVDDWRHRSSQSFEHVRLGGSHFLAREDSEELFAIVREKISKRLSGSSIQSDNFGKTTRIAC